jgi:hypothetical protein
MCTDSLALSWAISIPLSLSLFCSLPSSFIITPSRCQNPYASSLLGLWFSHLFFDLIIWVTASSSSLAIEDGEPRSRRESALSSSRWRRVSRWTRRWWWRQQRWWRSERCLLVSPNPPTAMHRLKFASHAPGDRATPDVNVTRIEDLIEHDILLPSKSTQPALPQRPAYGKGGRPIVLWANYMELAIKPAQVVYRYQVKFAPKDGKELSARIKKRLITLLMDRLNLKGANYVTDFSMYLHV